MNSNKIRLLSVLYDAIRSNRYFIEMHRNKHKILHYSVVKTKATTQKSQLILS